MYVEPRQMVQGCKAEIETTDVENKRMDTKGGGAWDELGDAD